MCHQLGIPIAPDKTFGPSTTLTFAGIELDKMRRHDQPIFEAEKSTPSGTTVFDRVPKFCDECDYARDRFS